jgi:hypothetical protein
MKVGVPEATENIRTAPVRALRAIFSGVGQLLLAADRLREEDAERERADRDEPDPLAEGRLSSAVRIIPTDANGSVARPAPAASAGRKPGRVGRARRAGKPGLGGQAAKPGRSDRKGGGRASGRGKKPAEPSPFRSLDLTGNVRVLTDQDIADLAADALERGDPWPVPREPKGEWGRHGPGIWSGGAPPWSSWSSTPLSDPQAMAARLPIAGYDELSLPSLRARLRQLSTDELDVLLAHERSNATREAVVTMFERRIAKLSATDE